MGWSLAGGGAVFRAGAGPRAGKLLPAGLRLSDCPQGVPLRARRDRRGRGVLGIRQLPKQLRRVQLLPRARRGRLLPVRRRMDQRGADVRGGGQVALPSASLPSTSLARTLTPPTPPGHHAAAGSASSCPNERQQQSAVGPGYSGSGCVVRGRIDGHYCGCGGRCRRTAVDWSRGVCRQKTKNDCDPCACAAEYV